MPIRSLPPHTAWRRKRSSRCLPLLGLVGTLFAVGLIGASELPWPEFSATTLSGESVSSVELVGSAPTILILTPSRAAAKSIRRWVDALHGRVDPDRYRLRDVIALNLPFFLSESIAVERARGEVPAEYHDETWLVDGSAIERAFDVRRESEDACVIVLGSGAPVARRRSAPAPRASALAKAREEAALRARARALDQAHLLDEGRVVGAEL